MIGDALAPERHSHLWAVVDLLVRDGRPMVSQRCACGAERQIRAFERTWQPDEVARRTGPTP